MTRSHGMRGWHTNTIGYWPTKISNAGLSVSVVTTIIFNLFNTCHSYVIKHSCNVSYSITAFSTDLSELIRSLFSFSLSVLLSLWLCIALNLFTLWGQVQVSFKLRTEQTKKNVTKLRQQHQLELDELLWECCYDVYNVWISRVQIHSSNVIWQKWRSVSERYIWLSSLVSPMTPENKRIAIHNFYVKLTPSTEHYWMVFVLNVRCGSCASASIPKQTDGINHRRRDTTFGSL